MTTSHPSNCPKCGAPIPEDAPRGLCPKCVLAAALSAEATTPSRRTPPPSIDDVADHFPQLEILELIGAGGMGAVYKARQPNLDRVVALKILSLDLGEDPAFTERFQREARVLARLNHPNIVNVFDTGTAGPYAFLLMEYVDGVNLRQAMRTGSFTPAEALSLVQDICEALKFAHEEGILHRDIKPENILIDSRGHVKIADFGIAKLIREDSREDASLTLEGSILGSPQYMAPEQIETPGDVDQRADIYSLGVVLYEMLTGELPIGRFALPSQKVPLDARIDDLVLRTLEKEREARYQTAEEVKTSVEAIHDPADPTESETSFFLSQLLPASKLAFLCSMIVLGILAFDLLAIFSDTADGSERVMHYAVAAVILGSISGIYRGIHHAFVEQRTSNWGGKPIPKTFLRVAMLLSAFSSLGVMVWVIVVMLRAHGGEGDHSAVPASPDSGGAANEEFYPIAEDQPRVDLDLTVAPGLVSTFALVRTDAVGKERIRNHHQGFILASDKKPWRGTVQFATIALNYETLPSTGPKMLSSIRSGSPEVVSLDAQRTSFFEREWEWNKTEPLQLHLTEPGRHDFKVASRSDLSQTLSLRVETRRRAVPGVPAAALNQVKLENAVCGLGEEIEWIRYLMEELKKQMEASEAGRPPREPEPEWREGQPESHVNLTVDPGVVAKIELRGPDGNGGGKTYHRGYIVASDLEPWEGKLRIGSLAGSTKIQWRIEGPFNTVKADIDPGWDWQVEPMATDSHVTKPRRATAMVISAGTVRSGGDTSFVSFVVLPVTRMSAKAELPEVLPVHVMGLGEEPDWVEGVKQMLKVTAQP